MIHMQRNFGKTVLLFSLIFVLSILSASAIQVRRAVLNTDDNLRRQLPAVATISQDIEAHLNAESEAGVEISIDAVRADLIREIGELSYVRTFDYTTWGLNFFSNAHIRSFDPELIESGNLIDHQSLLLQGLSFEQFILKGVRNPLIVDIEAGLIELIEGRTFTEFEIYSGSHVALVSDEFLQANSLQLGDMLVLDYRIYQEESGSRVVEEHFSVENLLKYEVFELEIIGVFAHEFYHDETPDWFLIQTHFDIINRIYVPNGLIESTLDLYVEVFLETNPELLEEFLEADAIEDIIQHEHMIFLLYDPIDLLSFRSTAHEILPDFWVVSDLSNAYGDISASMELLREVADGVLLGTILAMILVVSLLFILFSHERQHEIGIYLALGEKRKSIIGQILLEVTIASLAAIFLALIVGNILAREASTAMIRHHLVNQTEQSQSGMRQWQSPEMLGFRFEMTHEEMLENYKVHLDITTSAVFIGISFIAISISTVAPIIYITRLDPKSILLQGKIG